MTDAVKTCIKCSACKPKSDFYRNCKAADGLQSSCKACGAAYKLLNREIIRAKEAAYRAENTESYLAVRAKYRRENKEKIKASAVLWRVAASDLRKAYMLEWRARNPEACRTLDANRRARKRNADGFHSASDIQRLEKIQRHKCAVCKSCIKDGYHVDHVMPLALGGTNWPDNLQLLCRQCNLAKHAKHPVDFMQSRGFLL